jgi:8-oxo-dGTP pyrophosphatase MutT (NUDIX family)
VTRVSPTSVTSAESGGTGDPADDRSQNLPQFRPVTEAVVHRGWLITLNRASFVDPDGVAFERDIVRHPGAVAMVAITDSDTVILVHQYRPALDKWLLEIPAGTCDVDGEPGEVTARRELAEEAGVSAGSLTLLTRCAITPGFCDEYSSVYLCTDLAPVPVDRQGTEEHFMRIEEVPLSQFDAMVDSGAVVDATTILGVALARRHLNERD